LSRLSRFALWIVKTIGKEEASTICWHKNFKNYPKQQNQESADSLKVTRKF
jgi:hypothetical protein